MGGSRGFDPFFRHKPLSGADHCRADLSIINLIMAKLENRLLHGVLIKAGLMIATIAAMVGVARAEQYVCNPTASVGFKYDERRKDWEAARFKPEQPYLIRRPNASDTERGRKAQWIIMMLGERQPDALCHEDFVEDILECGTMRNFIFDRKLMRMITFYRHGYARTHLGQTLGPFKEGADSPSISMATCTKG